MLTDFIVPAVLPKRVRMYLGKYFFRKLLSFDTFSALRHMWKWMELTQKYLLRWFSLHFYSSIIGKCTNCVSFMVLLADGIHETSTPCQDCRSPFCALPGHFVPLACTTAVLSPTRLPWNFIGTDLYLRLVSFIVALVRSIDPLPTSECFRWSISSKTPVLSILNFSVSGGCVEGFHCGINLAFPDQ